MRTQRLCEKSNKLVLLLLCRLRKLLDVFVIFGTLERPAPINHQGVNLHAQDRGRRKKMQGLRTLYRGLSPRGYRIGQAFQLYRIPSGLYDQTGEMHRMPVVCFCLSGRGN
jgi:hypothetical protein